MKQCAVNGITSHGIVALYIETGTSTVVPQLLLFSLRSAVVVVVVVVVVVLLLCATQAASAFFTSTRGGVQVNL